VVEKKFNFFGEVELLRFSEEGPKKLNFSEEVQLLG